MIDSNKNKTNTPSTIFATKNKSIKLQKPLLSSQVKRLIVCNFGLKADRVNHELPTDLWELFGGRLGSKKQQLKKSFEIDKWRTKTRQVLECFGKNCTQTC